MGRDFVVLSLNQKDTVDNLKHQWRNLWQERLDDRFLGEAVALHDYNQLFIDKGTIIHATRDYQTVNFKEILQKHDISERFILDTHTGGWNKFIKTHITNHPQKHVPPKNPTQKNVKQQKKNGKGWLHT